jgi:hypothetical protein
MIQGMIQLKPYWHGHGNVVLRMVDVMLSTGQLNQLFAHSFFPTNVPHKV